jgi:hypothetical protein
MRRLSQPTARSRRQSHEGEVHPPTKTSRHFSRNILILLRIIPPTLHGHSRHGPEPSAEENIRQSSSKNQRTEPCLDDSMVRPIVRGLSTATQIELSVVTLSTQLSAGTIQLNHEGRTERTRMENIRSSGGSEN